MFFFHFLHLENILLHCLRHPENPLYFMHNSSFAAKGFLTNSNALSLSETTSLLGSRNSAAAEKKKKRFKHSGTIAALKKNVFNARSGVTCSALLLLTAPDYPKETLSTTTAWRKPSSNSNPVTIVGWMEVQSVKSVEYAMVNNMMSG